jgi:Family of unknown function (DUF5825)
MIAKPTPGLQRAGAYPARRTLTLLWPSALPDTALCAALANDGVSEVFLDGPVDLRDAGALEAIRFVRDCVAVGVQVRWSVSDPGGIDPASLTHLWPPDAFPGHDELLALWREFAFGVLFWRRGPSFAVVRDVRPAWSAAFYTLERDGTLQCFERLRVPTAVAQLPEDEREALESLREARLVLEIGAAAVALPYRIHKWPIPFMSV